MRRTLLALLLLPLAACGEPVVKPVLAADQTTREDPSPEPKRVEAAPETPPPEAVKPRSTEPVELGGMAQTIFGFEFDPADREKVGNEAWEQLRREFATLYAAEMKKPGNEAFEDAFGEALTKLRTKFGVAKPPEEEE